MVNHSTIGGGSEGFSFLGFTETLNWTTDQDMSVTLEVSDGCGQFRDRQHRDRGGEPAIDRDPARYADWTLHGSVFDVSPDRGGSGVYTYDWTQNFNPVGDEATLTYYDGLPTTFAVEVTDNCQSSGSASTTIVIDNPPLVTSLPDTINASCIDNTVVAVSIESGAGEYEYEWTVGGVPYGGSDPQITVRALSRRPFSWKSRTGAAARMSQPARWSFQMSP